MLKQLLFAWAVGLFFVGYYARHDDHVKEYVRNAFLEQFCAALDCSAQCRIESFGFNQLHLADLRVMPKQGQEWSWSAKHFSIAYSWKELCLYGTFDLTLQVKGINAYSAVQDDKLGIGDHLYTMFRGPQLTVHTILRNVMCEHMSIRVDDDEKDRSCFVQLDCKAKKIDNRLKASIDLFDGSLQAYDRQLLKQISGSLQLDSFDGQPTTDVSVKGAASFELPQLGAEVTPCYISGSWHHNCGSFSLKNIDHSFAVDPVIIKKDAHGVIASLEAKMPLSYIVHMCTNDNTDDRLQGICSVQAKLRKNEQDISYAGHATIQRMHWEQTEIGSLAKISFAKQQQTVAGNLYLQRTSGACFAGSWSSDLATGAVQAEMKNNARLTFSPKHDWQVFPDDLSVRFERLAEGLCALHYQGKATHAKARHAIVSDGIVRLDGPAITAQGTLDDCVYTASGIYDQDAYMQTFSYQAPDGHVLARLDRNEKQEYAGYVDVACIKDILKKHVHYDIQGEGICALTLRPLGRLYALDLHLHEGTIRLPRTYNFVNGLDCKLTLDMHNKRCIAEDFLCTLHNGVVRSKKAEIRLADDLSPRFVYAPFLIDRCLLNSEKELFAVVSGSMLLSKRQDTGALLSGMVLIERAQLKENLFSQVFQKNMRSLTAHSFNVRDDDMQCDIAVKTKYPVRVQTPFLQTDAHIDLHIRNRIRDPYLTGSVHLLGGLLHFPYKPLYITKGALHFMPGKADDPLIELEAKNSIKKNAINLHVSGSLQQQHVSLEASPTLSEEQIISLLLVGSQEESLNIVMPALIMQNIKSILFGHDQSSQMSKYFGKLFKPFKRIHLVPSFIDQSGRGGLRGAIEIELSERCRALIQKNFSLTEDTRFELEYMVSDDMSVRATRDIRRDLIAEVEMRYKFGNN